MTSAEREAAGAGPVTSAGAHAGAAESGAAGNPSTAGPAPTAPPPRTSDRFVRTRYTGFVSRAKSVAHAGLRSRNDHYRSNSVEGI